ncbi:isopentenyldiphosphate isomerase [Winogradskyella pacifica]|uniref:Isopentenyldiphosphate isomerase n=1 Tax=Winogradskyella pacifica TaxID=664642 RepID=A0A3D9N1Y4_9FLAO|nr:NUDIX domain-containing protein [Winogradskyella pacifica]REE25698.1 isopentenyldiphosphate isomerase [Winogradskyella pacifica]
MDEFLDIVDKNGQPTGNTALKSEAHAKGLYHNTIHLWLYTSKGEILLQQRSHKKIIFPLLWDVSVAGHIDAGETFIEAALRETEEEIGLKLDPKHLDKIGTFLHETRYADGKIQDNEFHQVYIAELTVPINALVKQESEVEALKLVTLKDFKDLLKQSETNMHFVASNYDYYLKVHEAIQTKLLKL